MSACPTVALVTAPCLTKEEAAAFLGVAVNTIRTYVSKGRLSPIPGTEGQGHRSLFRATDLEPLRGLQAAYNARRAEKRAEILATGQRECTGCHIVQPLTGFSPNPKGIGGRHSRCHECERVAGREHARKNRTRRCAYKREYRQKNKAAVSAYKREYSKRIRSEKNHPAAEHLREYFNDRHHLLRAVEDGKTSPLCKKHGFAVVRLPQSAAPERYRAARLDQRLQAGEKAVVHYEWGISGLQLWVVLRAPLETAAEKLIFERLKAREKRLRDKDGRRHPGLTGQAGLTGQTSEHAKKAVSI